MKFKKIMLITFILLAILTIGAASAADDVASDDIAVVDDGDVLDVSQDDKLEDMSEDDVDIEVNDIDRTEEDYENYNFTEISVTEKSGNYVICTGEGGDTVEVYRQDLSQSDDYYEDDDGAYHFGVSLNDVNNYIASTIDPEKNFYDIFDESDKCFRFVLEYGGDDFIVKSYDVDVGDDGITFSEITDPEDEYYIYVNEEELNFTDPDENPNVAGIVLPEDATGTFRIAILDEEDEEVLVLFTSQIPENLDDDPNWSIEEDGIHGDFYLTDIDIDQISDGDVIKFNFISADEDEEFIKIADVIKTESTIQFTVRDEEDDDADDGVIIHVPDGDDREYDLENDEDLNTPFAFVSVREDLNGSIVFMVWSGEEGEYQDFFSVALDDIEKCEDDAENEGFKIYMLSLNDLENYDDLIDSERFKLAFIDDNEDEIDSRSYEIEVDEENENIIRFWEYEEEDEPSGEGEVLEGVEFRSANAKTNGVVVVIPIANFPQDIVNEFKVTVITDDGEIHTPLKLDELEHDDSSYYIRVSDLNIDELEIEEGIGVDLIVQFYDEDDEPNWYAQTFDDEGIDIYNSPFFFDENSILYDDDVITIREIPDGVDEFTVTISKEGSEDIVKTFKFSEMDIDEDDVWVALHLTDLGITEEGDYEITVKYSDDLIYTGNINVNNDVDIRGPEEDDDGNPITFTSIDQRVVNFRISERMTGYVKLYVNGTQVGGDIDLASLPMGDVPPNDGRQILLNDLNITESGDYTVKVELYNDADELLGEPEYNITVEVGESSVGIKEGSYPYGTEANDEIIEYTIGSPLAEGQYFNIYFNGEKAGVITARGLEFNDEFTVPMFDVLLFKPGSYEVNVTFVDGESETEVTTGSFSINELVLTSDKEVYVYDVGTVIISFNADSLDDGDRLIAYYVYNWGPVGRDDSMIFPGPYDGCAMKEDGMYNDGVVSFDVARFVAEPDNDRYRLDVGDNLIYAVFEHGEEVFGGFIVVTVVEAPEPVDPELTIAIADITEGQNAEIKITTNATFSGNVSVKIGNSNYNVSVVNGTGSAPVSGLAVGTYNAVATFAATDVFKASEKNTTFTVKPKVATAITASAVTTTYATSKNIVVTLKDANGNVLAGKAVTVSLNGVSKTLTTNAKGQVSYAIGTKLVPKKYTASIRFAGDSTYLASTGSVKVTVNKAKAKMTAKKKAFKAKKKTKKYTIVLKTNKNKALAKVKVTLKIKGKKYTAKTNAKGKATFKIKKLTKKGKYKATVTFAGNKYYNKLTKKVKITVK